MVEDDQLYLLEEYFEDPELPEDVIDLMGLHGLLTAIAAVGAEPSWPELKELIFDSYEPDADTLEQLKAAILAVLTQIGSELYGEDSVALPFSISANIEESDMQAWCCGFLEFVFAHEDLFYGKSEEDVSHLLLPIELASGLFAQEPEFKTLTKDRRLFTAVLHQIPEVITDLYLLYNAPEK